jgi:hypothetical protein
MSQNLNLLRQKYCRPATFTGKRTDHLFPLEEECEQGKTLLAKAPKTLLYLQEFDPYGLQQTYRDEASGAELPPSWIGWRLSTASGTFTLAYHRRAGVSGESSSFVESLGSARLFLVGSVSKSSALWLAGREVSAVFD